MRRQLFRLLRLRSLIAATGVLLVLYAIKTLNRDEVVLPEQAHRSALSAPGAPGAGRIVIFVPSSLEKIDWHNHTQIAEEARRVGTGEQGKPAFLLPEEKSLEEQLYSVNGFNGALSDKIALYRSIPDIRHRLCRERLYIKSLPSVSVVVPFHNEHWSTLLRTAASVVSRSPAHLLKEVLLVDDASTKSFLKDKLEQYLARSLPKARVIRLPARSGLIAARLAGARAAAADVLVFLDAHTEANVNWLPPLLEPIALDYRTVVCPFIDVVAFDTFEYRAQDEGARGAFDWEFFYKRLPILPKDEQNMPDPFPSPVMAGGLFAISRAFFWQLGGYDPGLDIWGGEQYELSFKIWQCGGRMLDAPCSRVGHIYRKFAPFPNPGHGDFVGKNYRRVAEVWMDEYAQYLYKRRPHYLKIPTGNISEQIALREKLKCKSFRWFMTQVAFDLTAKYPPVEPKPFGEGRIRPRSRLDLCAQAAGGALRLAACRGRSPDQQFQLTWHKDVKCKDRGMCWDLPESRAGSPVLLYSCHLGGGNQEWRLDTQTGQMKKSDTVCLDWDVPTLALFVNPCDAASDTQRWTVDRVDADMAAKWHLLSSRVTGPQLDVSY